MWQINNIFFIVVSSVDSLKLSCVGKKYALSNNAINQPKFL